MAVMVLVLTNEARGFEHLKHKFKLKKLAKLAFAARFLPHLIPLPIPMPIIKRHRHKQTFKVSARVLTPTLYCDSRHHGTLRFGKVSEYAIHIHPVF